MHFLASTSKASTAHSVPFPLTPSHLLAKSLGTILLSIALIACGRNEDVSSTTAPVNSSSDALDSATSKKVVDVTPQAQNPSEPLAVSTVKVGSALDSGKHILKESTTFGKKDSVYVVVETTGSGKGTLSAKWIYIKNGKHDTLEQTSQEISTAGPAVTEFHILQNNGWKKGSYLVDIDLDGNSVAIKEFRVD